MAGATRSRRIMTETTNCPTHNITVYRVSKTEADERGLPFGCSECRAALASAPDPTTMTPQERADELTSLLDTPDYAGFDVVWKRVDELVGRGTMTHELAYPEYLVHEILTSTVPSIEGIIAKFPPDKPVIVIDAP